jgi:hypothetical protein
MVINEHSGAFDPDEVHTLVAAFDKAWETVQASLDRRDQELLDKQMRRLVPPQNDGAIAVMLAAAMFLVGMALGNVLSAHQSEPIQIASME